jgi:hypothetical protein
MADVSGKFYSATKVRTGVSPSSPGVEVGETLPPVNPPGSDLNSVGLTMPAAFAVANSPLTSNGTIAVTGAGTIAQYIRGDGSLETFPSLTGFVPYTGATADVDLGTHDLTAERGTFTNNGSSDTLTVNHTSGSGYGIIVTKGGNNEALYVSKTSGSGNAMTVIGGRTSLVDLALSSVTNTAGDFLTLSGGVVHKRTAAEVRTDIGAGTVTSVAALTLGTSGTDLSSSVANGTTTPVITLNVPTASASNRGALSAADWTTFNNKTSNLGTVTSVGLSSATSGVTIGSTPITTSGTITLAIATASGSQNGLLSSTDWTTFNGKQNALTNPVTGTGTSGQVAYFTGTSAISSESNLFWDATNDRLGIGTDSPVANLQVVGNTLIEGGSSSLNNVANLLDLRHLGSGFNGFEAVIRMGRPEAANRRVLLRAFGTGLNFQTPNFAINVNEEDRMRIFSNGNTFIGSSPSDAGFKLDVNGTGRFSGTLEVVKSSNPYLIINDSGVASTGGILFQPTGFNAKGGLTLNFATAEQRLFTGEGGNTYFQTFYTNGTERMRITAAGRVLIGTPPPAESTFQLDVNGTGRFSGSTTFSISGATNNILISQSTISPTYGVISLNGITTEGSYIGIAGGGGTDKSLYLQSGNGGDLIFRTGNGSSFSTKLTIANAGAATFSSSVTATSIIRSGGTSSQYLMADGSVSTLTNPVTGTGTAGQVAYWSSTSAITGESNLFWDATNNRLGIGTASPQAPLHVIAASSADNALIQEWSYTSGTTDQYSLMLKQTITSGVCRYNFSMVNNNVAYDNVLVLDRGNVGIGTTSPTSRLQVSGSFATPHTTKSANYTLTASDFTVGFDCASNRTATLPDATTCAGRIYVIYQYNTNLGIRYVTLDGNGSQTINGITTYPLQYYGDFSSVMIQSTGSNWVVISDALYFIPV